MLAHFETFLTRLKPLLLFLVKGGVLFILVGLGVLFFEWKGLSWLASQDWATRLGVIPKLGERVTVIERKESVSITQDENIERMVAEYGSVIVGIIEETVPTPRSSALTLAGTRLLSGAFVTNDGLLVTYRERAPLSEQNRYTVFLASGEKKEAQVAGYDTLTNLLYLHVDGINTPAVSFTNSTEVKAGRRMVLLTRDSEGVAVMANIIGKTDRTFNLNPQTVASSEKWEGTFSLGTPLTKNVLGSSALLLDGEMAGMLGTVRVDGVDQAFLIPANAIRESLDRFIGGNVARPVAGIYYLTVTSALQEILGLTTDRGALIYSPSERTGLSLIALSPAARADLQFGDIITAVNDTEINLDLPLSVALGRLKAGDTVRLKVLRSGVEREVTLSL